MEVKGPLDELPVIYSKERKKHPKLDVILNEGLELITSPYSKLK